MHALCFRLLNIYLDRLYYVLYWLWNIYEGIPAPKCIFHNQYKIWYNLFSPYPAVSCVSDTPVLDLEIYILCRISLHSSEESLISLLAMDAFRTEK